MSNENVPNLLENQLRKKEEEIKMLKAQLEILKNTLIEIAKNNHYVQN